MRSLVPLFGNGSNGIVANVGGVNDPFAADFVDRGADVETGNGTLANEQYSISISNLISNVKRSGIVENTVENAYYDIVSDQLFKSVSELSASNILNVADTLSGTKVFNINDWKQIAADCRTGKFDLGVMDAAGNVQALFKDDGGAYANIGSPDGTTGWASIISPSTTIMGEAPEKTATKLGAIAKVATTSFVGTPFTRTGVAYADWVAPTVSSTGVIQFSKPMSYAGITATLPGTSFEIVAAQQINRRA